VTALLLHLLKDGALDIELTEEITAGVVITYGGQVVQHATAKLLEGQSAGGAA
jgi:hypothetical protein